MRLTSIKVYGQVVGNNQIKDRLFVKVDKFPGDLLSKSTSYRVTPAPAPPLPAPSAAHDSAPAPPSRRCGVRGRSCGPLRCGRPYATHRALHAIGRWPAGGAGVGATRPLFFGVFLVGVGIFFFFFGHFWPFLAIFGRFWPFLASRWPFVRLVRPGAS